MWQHVTPSSSCPSPERAPFQFPESLLPALEEPRVKGHSIPWGATEACLTANDLFDAGGLAGIWTLTPPCYNRMPRTVVLN